MLRWRNAFSREPAHTRDRGTGGLGPCSRHLSLTFLERLWGGGQAARLYRVSPPHDTQKLDILP